MIWVSLIWYSIADQTLKIIFNNSTYVWSLAPAIFMTRSAILRWRLHFSIAMATTRPPKNKKLMSLKWLKWRTSAKLINNWREMLRNWRSIWDDLAKRNNILSMVKWKEVGSLFFKYLRIQFDEVFNDFWGFFWSKWAAITC